MYKNSDETFLLTLQSLLTDSPRATQREIAARLDISLGLANRILTRVAGRGWVRIDRVNARNMQYAITAAGQAELARLADEQKRRTFAELHDYGEHIAGRIERAKADGYGKVVLYGESGLDFLIAHECERHALPFERRGADELSDVIESDVYAVTGERDAADCAGNAVSVMEMVG